MKQWVLQFLIAFAGGVLGSIAWNGMHSVPIEVGSESSQLTPHILQMDQDTCAKEASEYCNDANSLEGGVNGCLIDYLDKLSGACRAKIEPLARRWAVCKTDIEKHCPGTQPGRMRVPKCLRVHMSSLKAACRDVLKTVTLPSN